MIVPVAAQSAVNVQATWGSPLGQTLGLAPGIPGVASGTFVGPQGIASLSAGASSAFSGLGGIGAAVGAGVPPGFGAGSGSGYSIFGPWGLYGPYDIFGPMGLFGYQNHGLYGPGAILFPNLMINGWWNGVC